MIKIKHDTNILKKLNHGYAVQMYKPYKEAEKIFEKILHQDSYYIVRFDGKNMSKDFKIKQKDINECFFNTMKDTFQDFCKSKPQIVAAYCFSDEISILIKGTASEKNYTRVEKILSLFASELSIRFFKNSQKNHLNLKNPSLFDARILELKKEELFKYFLSRQAFAIEKYIMQLKGEYQINFKESICFNVIELLKKQNILYEKLPEEYRYGLFYHPQKEIQSFDFFTETERLKDLLNA